MWGTLKSGNVKSVKSVNTRVCKIGEVHIVRKDRVKPGTNKSMKLRLNSSLPQRRLIKTCHHKLIPLWLQLLMLQALLMLQCQMLKIISLAVNHQMTWIGRMTQQHLIALEKMNV